MAVINTIVGLGPSVMMPIIFFILAIISGVKLGQAFKAGMMVGIGFQGISILIGLLLDSLGPAAEAIVTRFGIDLRVVDVGWPVGATIAWGTPIVPIVVFGALVLNVLLLTCRVTNTLNIDIFNYWQFLMIGGIAYAATGKALIGVIVSLIAFVVTLIIADKSAPRLQREFGMEGVSFAHALCTVNIPVGIVINKIIELIPGIRKIDINSEKISKRFGVLGEPLTQGVILGAVLGILAGMNAGDVMVLAVKMASVMVLLPVIVDVLISGLTTVKDATEILLKKRFPGRDIYIGMDPTILMTPEVMATGMLLIPITLVLAIILPGNVVLPFVDLASLLFLVLMITTFCRRNMFRMLIAGIVLVTMALYIGGDVAEFYTKAAGMTGVETDGSLMTNLAGGGTTYLGWLLIKIASLFGV